MQACTRTRFWTPRPFKLKLAASEQPFVTIVHDVTMIIHHRQAAHVTSSSESVCYANN